MRVIGRDRKLNGVLMKFLKVAFQRPTIMISTDFLASQASIASSLLSEIKQVAELEEVEETNLSAFEQKTQSSKVRKALLGNPDLSSDLSFNIGIVGPDEVGKRFEFLIPNHENSEPLFQKSLGKVFSKRETCELRASSSPRISIR